MAIPLSKCTVNIVDFREGIPKVSEQEVFLNDWPVIVPIAYPFGLAFEKFKERGSIDITAINIELGRESLVCQLHTIDTCKAIIFVVVGRVKLEGNETDCLYVHLCEIEPCKGVANVTSGANLPQTC